ncbi:PAC2 family protein [Candidatus Woesearchaeota archaeon]|nr:PAC2 family protein [Candidatus Woesearchaeota archaeon]
MDIRLRKKPKGATLIEGFPGFGLVGTIVTEYLLEHLPCEQIGELMYDELPATVAIHKGKLVHPMGVFYNKKYNVVILHAILDIRGHEWAIAQAVEKLVKTLEVKEILSIEGVTGDGSDELFCFQNKKFETLGAKPVEESVIIGVTAALLLRQKKMSCLFAQTHSNMPDSRAAAKIIELLDKYLGFKLDTKPLLMQAEIFEAKVKDLMQKANKTTDEVDKKQMSYLG